MKKISFAFLFCACSFLGAVEIEDILAFKNSGDSSAWYHELILDAYNPEKTAEAEELVLRAMSSPEISDEAFRLCAKILKPSASQKSLKVLPTLLTKDARVMPVFDVLISFDKHLLSISACTTVLGAGDTKIITSGRQVAHNLVQK